MSATASSEPPSSGYQHHTQTQSPPQDRSQYPRETSPRLAVSYKTSPVSDSVATSQSINSLSPSNHDTLSSKLSPTAPQFHAMQRDSPIDIHSLPLPQESNLLPTSTRPPETTLRTPALSALSSSVSNGALDFSANAAISSQPPAQGTASHFSSSQLSSFNLVVSPSPSITSLSPSLNTDDNIRTPNVYINGLPPNCPEEDLYKLASTFGDVVSVRTFTRHVSDKPSGYGFVLFHSVDAAEKCINELRKHRYLHPSFSKRVHKIPGTEYASVSVDSNLPNALSTATVTDPERDTFKTNMERLKDPNSTNLYMEGLPLTINESILTALVSPYKIMSNRLFQTRLSDPPRMIAFVRLESREAAEEIVERLHGRMVRGWNDSGCRISVRFADTSEQRELRRNERLNRDGDHSPGRLTVAHASLLNMSGSQGRYLSPPGSQSGFSPKVNANLPLSTLPFLPSPPPIIGFQHLEQHGQPKITNALQVAYDSIPSRLPSRYDSVSPIHANYGRPPNSGIRMPQQTFAPIEESTSLRDRVRLGMGNGGGVVSRAHNGYTPVEQRMIQQAQSRRQGPTRLAAGPLAAANYQTMSDLVGPGMAGSIRGSTYRLTDFGNAMTEEDFHAGASGYEFTSPTLDVGHFGTGSALGSAVCSPAIEQTRSFASPRFSLDDISAKISFNRQRNQTDSSRTRTQLGPQTQMHTRSTTLPPHSLNSDRASGRSGIISSTDSHLVNPSPPSNTRDYTDIESTTNRMGGLYLGGSPTDSSRPQDRGAAVGPSSRAVVDNSQPHFPKNNRPYDSRSINSSIHSHQRNDTSNSQFPDGTNAADTVKSDAHTPNNIMTHTSPMHNPMNTGNSLSLPNSHAEHLNSLGAHTPDNLISPMHSPALTHTPQTPATLSPATPFSTFSEPFTVSRSGNGKVEVGLGMHVGVAHATGLEVVRDDHGKTREMAVSQDGQATKNAT